MMIRRLVIIALSLLMIVLVSACGSNESASSGGNAVQHTAEPSTLTINIDGTTYLVDARAPWREIGDTIGNLSVTLQAITSRPAQNAEHSITTLSRTALDDLYTTTLNGQTIYIADGSGSMDLFVIYNEADLFIFNITTIGDAEVATYQEEIAQIMSTLRPQ